MLIFLSWYLLITVINLLIFPLVFALFPRLEDRGYSLARAFGLLLWGYLFWIMASAGIAQNDLGGLMLAGILTASLSIWVGKKHLSDIKSWLKNHLSTVIMVEVIFLLSFALLAVIRAANPDITGTEKPMELAFINAILRSPEFPPRDPWLSGYGISYYYFGYVMTAMLARVTAVTGGVAFNMMLSLVFAMSSVGAYGLVFNLFSLWKKSREGSSTPINPLLPILGPVFLLFVSNFEGFLEVLHSKGFFWKISADGSAASRFWSWLDIKDLNQAPIQPASWIPDRYLWWWRASRVVSDTTLTNARQELIDEFPVFSFLLGDMHPHVLSIPFILLALAVGLNIILGSWQGETRIGNFSFPIRIQGFLVAFLVIGGLAFLNTWDILIAAAVITLSFLLQRILFSGWKWGRMLEVFSFALIVVVGSLLLYLPFFIHFSSQAGGILPNLINPTRGAHLWVMFGPLFIPVIAYLFYAVFNQKKYFHWKPAILSSLGLVSGLWLFAWLLGLIVAIRIPDQAASFLQSQGLSDYLTLFSTSLQRRIQFFGGLLTLLVIMIPTLGLLIGFVSNKHRNIPDLKEEDKEYTPLESNHPQVLIFTLILILLAGVLVLGPDFIYLRDQFGWRINTIFKFYYQAWILWSIAAGFGVAVLLSVLKRFWKWIFRFSLIMVLGMAMTYTILSVSTKTNSFDPYHGWTLDGTAYIQHYDPDEVRSIAWLNQAPDGHISEAIGGSYSNYARISTNTGLPTVLGWPGHESQWRGSLEPQGTRQQDIQTLYETSSWEEAEMILSKYAIKYVYLGNLERMTYQVNENKFIRHLGLSFSQGSVKIYSLP